MDHNLTSKDTLNIVVCHETGDASDLLVEHIRRGIEEEQMPARLINGTGSSGELARIASQSSLLGIGVGVDREGIITLTHFQMPADQHVIQVFSRGSTGVARIMGGNAARLFKKLPFKDWRSTGS